MNRVTLIGHLGNDPEINYTKNDDMVANFRLATKITWKNDQGVKQERTEWHQITCFKGFASRAKNYLKKGSRVFIEGTLKTQQYLKNDEKHFSTKIILQGNQGQIIFLSPVNKDKNVTASDEDIASDEAIGNEQ